MIETLATETIKNTVSHTITEQDPAQLAQELAQSFSASDGLSDNDIFRHLIEAYPNSGLAENIKASNEQGAKRKKNYGILDNAISAIHEMNDDWQKTLNQLNMSRGHPPSVEKYVEANFVFNKASSMLSLVGTVVGKSVQHLETLLRMQ